MKIEWVFKKNPQLQPYFVNALDTLKMLRSSKKTARDFRTPMAGLRRCFLNDPATDTLTAGPPAPAKWSPAPHAVTHVGMTVAAVDYIFTAYPREVNAAKVSLSKPPRLLRRSESGSRNYALPGI